MWIIKYVDKITHKEKTIEKEKFDDYNGAFQYISENMPDIEDVWPEEEFITDTITDKLDFDNLVGKYAYVMSKKKNEFFCYGIIMDVVGLFVYIKTRPNQETKNDFAFYRKEKIKDLYANKCMKFEEQGCFVESLKDYL